jgi:hypothetical protein
VVRDVGDDLPTSIARLKTWAKELFPLVELTEVVMKADRGGDEDGRRVRLVRTLR